MTKRIIAMALVVVMAMVALVACGEAAKTEAPATTPAGTTSAPATTPAGTTSAPTTAPATTPADTTVVEPTPSETPAPTEIDPFIIWGGSEYMFATGSLYGAGYENWPATGSTAWCPNAFWQLCVWLGKEDADFTENIETPADYDYTWTIWFKDMELDGTEANWGKGYPCTQETYYDGGDRVIYRLQTDTDLEAGPTKTFEVGKTYEIVIQVKKGEENQGFMYLSMVWSDEVAARYACYKNFWTTQGRDRNNGYLGSKYEGSYTLTEADIAFAESVGYQRGTDNNGNLTLDWVGLGE